MTEPYLQALAGAEPYPYWLDDPDEPDSLDTLVHADTADLCVIGGGYTGLWTAILAKERDPSRDVVVLEAATCGSAASGRNGGFFESSLTHGAAQGLDRFAKEVAFLEQLGLDNLNAIEAFVEKYRIDCDWERNGVIDVLTDVALLDDLQHSYHELVGLNQDVELFDRERMQAEVHSPTYQAGMYRKRRAAICDPARLAFGMKDVALDLGVRIFEDTKATDIAAEGHGVRVQAGYGSIRSARVALATNAFPPLVKSMKRRIVPVYDYCLATEPLSAQQLDSIGWRGRQGLGDTTNQFHYYRLTQDNRIIWGGYDAVYYFGNKMGQALEQRPETFSLLSQHFHTTFPQLEGLGFSHAWGGAIDTSTRFTVFWGTEMNGRVAYRRRLHGSRRRGSRWRQGDARPPRWSGDSGDRS
ncbi:MAG: FAD-dependent oxidoreductase [Acidimicrobiales bacterium]